MKTVTLHMQKYISICLFTILGTVAFSQEIFVGTYKDGEISNLDKIHVSHLNNFKIKLDGVNTAQYKVVFKFDDFDWDTEPEAILGTLLPNLHSLTGELEKLSRSKTESQLLASNVLDQFFTGLNLKLNLVDQFPQKIESQSVSQIKQMAIDDLKKLNCTTEQEYDKLFSEFQYEVAYLISFYESLKEFNAQSPNSEYEFTEKLASIKQLYDRLKGKNYVRLLKLIISFAKKEPLNYAESDIHFPDKEVTSLQIYLIDQFDLTDTLYTYTTDIYRTGVFKLDFSTGIGVNSLIKPTYYLGNNGTTSYISKENGRDADLSVMALVHANWRISRRFTVGPVAGVSISTFDANTGFVLGLGTSIGTKNTLSISAGGIMGKSYQLSSRVSTDGNTQDIPLESDITEIPKIDAVNYGWFVSLTYNLSRTKKKE